MLSTVRVARDSSRTEASSQGGEIQSINRIERPTITETHLERVFRPATRPKALIIAYVEPYQGIAVFWVVETYNSPTLTANSPNDSCSFAEIPASEARHSVRESVIGIAWIKVCHAAGETMIDVVDAEAVPVDTTSTSTELRQYRCRAHVAKIAVHGAPLCQEQDSRRWWSETKDS